MDEREEFKAIQGGMKQLLKPFEAIATIKTSDPDLLEKVSATFKKLPPADVFAGALEELRTKASEFVAQARSARVQGFGRVEAEYIRGAQEAGQAVRESGEGWRLGPLELEVRRQQAEARFLYNHEPITGWAKVATSDDLNQLEVRALETLTKSEIPEKELVDTLWNAYRMGIWRRQDGRSGSALLLQDLFVEFRLEQAHRELSGGKPDRKLSQAEFPRWAFLYNLDRYRAMGSQIPEAKRLGFQTGNQAETTRVGMPLNGLNAMQDYKKYCYVVPVRGS